jgi:hypothetical protein
MSGGPKGLLPSPRMWVALLPALLSAIVLLGVVAAVERRLRQRDAEMQFMALWLLVKSMAARL